MKIGLKKSQKNIISRKLQGFEQTFEAKIATSESILTDSNNRIDIFKIWNFLTFSFF